MKDYMDKFLFVEEKLKEGRKIKPLIDEEKEKRNIKKQNNEELDIIKDFVYYDKMCGIVNEMLDNLISVRTFLEENKEEIIRISQQKQASFFPENEDLSGLTEEEKAKYLEYKDGKLDNLLNEIFESEELTDKFFNEVFPKNLEKEFGLSRKEYDELLAATDKSLEKELVIQEILEKIILKQENETPQVQFDKLSITNQLIGNNNKPNM